MQLSRNDVVDDSATLPCCDELLILTLQVIVDENRIFVSSNCMPHRRQSSNKLPDYYHHANRWKFGLLFTMVRLGDRSL
jgi:hypothetical protein